MFQLTLSESLTQDEVEQYALDFNMRFALAQATNDVLADGTAAAYSSSARQRLARKNSAGAGAEEAVFLDQLYIRHEHLFFADGPNVLQDRKTMQSKLEVNVPLESNDVVLCSVRVAFDSGLYGKLLAGKSRQFQDASVSLMPKSSTDQVNVCKTMIDARLAELREMSDRGGAGSDAALGRNTTLEGGTASVLGETDLIVVVVISILGGILLVLFCVICCLCRWKNNEKENVVLNLQPSSALQFGRGGLPPRGIIAQQAWQRPAVLGPSATLQPARKVQVESAAVVGTGNEYAHGRAADVERGVLGKYGVLSPRKVKVENAPQMQSADDWQWDVAAGLQLHDPYQRTGGANTRSGGGGGGGGPTLSSFGVTNEAGIMANFEESYMLHHGDDHNTYTWDNQAWAEGALSYPGQTTTTTTAPTTASPSSRTGGGRHGMTIGQSRLTKQNAVYDPFTDGTAYV